MLQILRGEFGSPSVTDYVVLETSLLLHQRAIQRGLKTLSDFLRENKIRILFIIEDIFSEALKLTFQKTDDFISLTDSTQIILSRSLNVNTIATFDSVLGNFFETRIGKGYFEHLEEREKRLLSDNRR